MRDLIIGCDPGVEGAIVVLSSDGKIKAAYNMPFNETEKPKVKKKPRKPKVEPDPTKKPKKKKPESLFTIKRKVDYPALVELFKGYFPARINPEIYVEEITHLFNLPSTTNFDLGYGIGILQAAIQTVHNEFYIVPVKKWQAGIWEPQDMVYKENKRVDTKATTKNAFNRIFPDYQGINSDGVRDAALIAYFGYKDGAQ